jgi:hypothetical protein
VGGSAGEGPEHAQWRTTTTLAKYQDQLEQWLQQQLTDKQATGEDAGEEKELNAELSAATHYRASLSPERGSGHGDEDDEDNEGLLEAVQHADEDVLRPVLSGFY